MQGIGAGDRVVTDCLDAQQAPVGDLPKEKLEALWLDPALKALKFGPGVDGARAYAESLRSRLATKWTYVAFFTKYPLQHFAYASDLGGPYLVMDYANDDWGPDNLDRIFAHETGHIFNAPDEYAKATAAAADNLAFTRCETATASCAWPRRRAPSASCVIALGTRARSRRGTLASRASVRLRRRASSQPMPTPRRPALLGD
jgi:hypothetical protein